MTSSIPAARGDLAPFAMTVCGIAELDGHCAVGVSHVLSILDPGMALPAAFGAYGEHVRLDMRFHDIIDPIEGMVAPEEADVETLLGFGRDLVQQPAPAAHLLVHCHMGISRSTAAMSLIVAQACPDRSADEVMQEIRRIRPQAWPNLRMIEMGDAMLGRGGSLIAAARAQYSRRFHEDARFRDMMLASSRHREFEGLIP